MYPAGEECYGCFGTRRRFYDVPMEKLNEARRADSNVEEKFCLHRRDKVSGENKYAGDAKVDLTHAVVKSKDLPSGTL